MTFSAPKPRFIAIVSITLISAVSSVAHADGIGTYKKTVPNRQAVRTVASTNGLDCSPVIYDYGDRKVTKTVCSPPWTGPATSAESGPTGSSSSTTQ